MRINLIHPSLERSDSFKGNEGPRVGNLTMPTVAALTPPGHEVVITDERAQEIDYDAGWDLVGTTFVARLALRSYRIAEEFRKRGVPTVAGGYHPTALPGEVARHFDAVVIGEAEYTWPEVVQDAERGQLKKFYRADRLHDMKNMPMPRRDLLNRWRYMTINLMEATRGCPHRCSFCFTPGFYSGRFRMRPISEVIAELKTLRGRDVVFVDDNIIGNRRYARELFEAMIPLKKWWFSQSTITLAEDDELLKLAARSGCSCILAGLETLSTSNLRQVDKRFVMTDRYSRLIRKLHDHGISLVGSFIVGFDGDDATVFRDILDFSIENRIEFIQCNPLTPFPGTPFEQLPQTRARTEPREWWLEDFPYVYKAFYKPDSMTTEDLETGCTWLMKEFYSYASIFKRARLMPLGKMLWYLFGNVSFRAIADQPVDAFNPNPRPPALHLAQEDPATE